MGLKITGYEKFWNALLAGNSSQVPIIATLALIGYLVKDPSYIPTKEVIIGAVGIFWGTLWAAFGAYMATTTPLDENGNSVKTTTITQPGTTTTEAGTTTVKTQPEGEMG